MISITCTPGTAEPTDYSCPTSYTIPAGEDGSGKSFSIQTHHDDDAEDETFTATYVHPDYPNVWPVQEFTILDDDTKEVTPPSVSLRVAPNPVTEGLSVTVTAELSAALGSAVTIPVTLSAGSAEDGDYGSLSSIRIGSGSTTGTGTITTTADADTEDETFTVSLGSLPSSVTSGSPDSVTVTITDTTTPAPTTRTAPPPSAWLARFARAVTDHAVDALGARLADDGRGRSYVVFAGMPLWGGADGPAAASAAFGGSPHGMFVGPRDPGRYGAGFDAGGTGGFAFPMANGTSGPAGGGGVAGMPFAGPVGPGMHGPGAGAGLAPPLLSGPGRGRRPRDGMPTRPLDALLGSSFRLSSQTGGGGATSGRPRLAAWGHAAGSFFDGAESGAELDGEVATWLAGVDAGWRRWLAGVAVAHSRGHGWSYGDGTSLGVGFGEFTGTLTAVHPYVRFRASERVSAWGLLGYGAGGLTLQGVSEFGWRTDTALRMAAGGARGVFLRGRSGLELAGKFDARRTHVASDAADGRAGRLAATAGDISRVRLAFEGSRRFALRGRRLLTPVVEVGLRRDGGVAETGFGLDLGGALRWADPQRGLVVEAAGRVLAAHQDEDYREWGASASVRLDPGRAERGLALALTPSWGAAPAGGADRLWSLRDARALGARGGPPEMRVAADAAYGLDAFRGRGVMAPYGGVRLSGFGRDWRAGVRWSRGRSMAFAVEGMRRELSSMAPDHGVALTFMLR